MAAIGEGDGATGGERARWIHGRCMLATMRRVAPLFVAVVAACGDANPPSVRPPPDLDAVMPEFHASATAMSDLLGLAYQLPAGADPASQAIRAFTLPAVQTAGIRHARADLLWNEVEPTPGVRDFTAYRTKVDAFATAGVVTLPILCYGNPWANATPNGAMTPPDSPADFAAFAGAAATSFRGSVPAYEVWNEENLGFRFWQPREDPAAYGALLTATSAAIRAADPAAKVVFGGVLYHGLLTDAEPFLEQVYTQAPNIGAAYDVLGVHTYPDYPPAVEPELDDDPSGEVAQPRMIARLRALLAYYGDDPARPIWVTEVGWPVFRTVDEELQARWLVRTSLLLAGAGVERVYLYTLFDGPDPTSYPPEDAFGLFQYADPSAAGFAPTPKLGWTALSTLLSVAGSLAVTSDVTAALVGGPPAARGYQLTDPTGTSPRRVTVVWSTDDTAAPATVTVPVTAGATLHVVDMLGAPLAASATVPVSGRPVYVIEEP